MTNDSSDLIRRAQEGDTDAIAAFLDQSLYQNAIQSKVERRGSTLIVHLQGTALSQETVETHSVAQVLQRIRQLQPAPIKAVTIHCQTLPMEQLVAQKPPPDFTGPVRLLVHATIVWIVLFFFTVVVGNAISGYGQSLVSILFQLFVLTPWSFQESVGFVTHYQVHPRYWDALGINTLGVGLPLLICFLLWSMIPSGILLTPIRGVMYSLLVFDANLNRIDSIRGLEVALLMYVFLTLPTESLRWFLLGS